MASPSVYSGKISSAIWDDPGYSDSPQNTDQPKLLLGLKLLDSYHGHGWPQQMVVIGLLTYPGI